ncbi:MAG: ABC transporter substrate-binding protein [Deltaproteobacteria bacterium]|nr:ABC transporter substrate-binding protein [Deltaproteobacteria bacterium]
MTAIFWSQYLQAGPVSKVNVALFHTFSKASSFCYDPYGQNFERGVRLAWNDFKKEHTQLTYDISFTKYDYDDNKLKAIEVVDEAKRDGASVGMGFMCSDFAILGGGRAQKNKLPLITPTATDDRIARIGDYVKMGIYTNSVQGSILAAFAYKDMAKRKTLIISAANCTYCISLANAYRNAFEALGGQVIGEYDILTSDTDFSSLLAKVKTQDFDSVLLPNYAMQSALIISQFLKSDIVSTFLGGDGWTWSKQIYDIINDNRLEAYFTISWR